MTDPGPDATTADDHQKQNARSTVSRRAMLASAGTTAAIATAGCVRQVRSIVNREGLDRLSLTITTVPADGDRESIQLARTVRDALETVGVDVSIDMRSNEEFLRSILINHDFDLYVSRHPGDTDPAFLYEMVHSRYADESGWQNPFGFTNMTVDDVLETQRGADGENRRETVADSLNAIAAEQPFVPICVPTEYRLARTDRFDGWGDRHPTTRLGYLGLDTVDGDNDGLELRGVHTDARPSQNLNPLTVEYRDRGTVTDLVYDSLAVDPITDDEFVADPDAGADGEGNGDDTDDTDDTDEDVDTHEESDLEPWLASGWEWDGSDNTDDTDDTDDADDADVLAVELREDLQFHDGESLTAEDVAFTYRFLQDTSLGTSSVPAPSPRYRGLVDALDEVAVDEGDDRRLDLSLASDVSRAVGERALTIPILPRHVWQDRSGDANVRGVRVSEGTTDALVVDNVPAIGSGPYRFNDRTDREHVTFERFDDHFTLREDVDLPAPTAERFRLQIDPRSTSAITLVEDDAADVTSSTLESYVVDDVLEREAEGAYDETDVRVLESPSWSFYHLGFNTRKAPFSNPRFRRVVARLLDKEWIVESVFDGHARPTATPVTRAWTPDELAWNGEGGGEDDDEYEDPVTPFFGTNGSGEIDGDAARTAFEDAGFSFDAEGRLRVRY